MRKVPDSILKMLEHDEKATMRKVMKFVIIFEDEADIGSDSDALAICTSTHVCRFKFGTRIASCVE